jgi:hypothetical protein
MYAAKLYDKTRAATSGKSLTRGRYFLGCRAPRRHFVRRGPSHNHNVDIARRCFLFPIRMGNGVSVAIAEGKAIA